MIKHKFYYKIKLGIPLYQIQKVSYLPVYRLNCKPDILAFTQAYIGLAIAYKYNTEGIYWELVERRFATSVSIIRSPVYFHVMKLYNENKELFNL